MFIGIACTMKKCLYSSMKFLQNIILNSANHDIYCLSRVFFVCYVIVYSNTFAMVRGFYEHEIYVSGISHRKKYENSNQLRQGDIKFFWRFNYRFHNTTNWCYLAIYRMNYNSKFIIRDGMHVNLISCINILSYVFDVIGFFVHSPLC